MSGRDFGCNKRIGTTAVRMRLVVIAAALGLLLAPLTAGAQGLPSADELDADQPRDEEIAPEQPAEPDTPAEPEAPADSETSDDEDTQADADDQSEDGDESEQSDESDEDAQADSETSSEEDAGAAGDVRYVDAGVNIEGVRGFQHLSSAIPGKPNTYQIALLGTFTKGSGVIRHQDENEFLAGDLLLQANLHEHFSANLGLGASNNVNTFGRPQAMLAQGDVHLGLRGHLNPQPGVYVAGDLTTFFPTGFTSAGLDLSATSVRPRLVATADFGEITRASGGQEVPLAAHFNFGYRFDNTGNLVSDEYRPTRVERFAHAISGYDFLEFGLGLEYALPYVSPFLAWHLDIPVNPDEAVCTETAALECVSDVGFAGYPDVLSVGARAEPVEHLGLTLGLDIGLTGEDVAGVPVTPPWQLIMGASWTIDPEPEIEYIETEVEKEVEVIAPQGFVLGTITDEQTGDVIEGATVTYLAPDEKTAQSSSGQGTFRSYGFEPGSEMRIRVSHPHYKPREASQVVEDEGDVELAVQLEPLPREGTIGGVVIDQEGEPIADATITLTGPDVYEVTTGPEGRFQRETTAGEYTVAAKADGFLTGGRDLEVTVDRELQVEITLKPEPSEKLVEVEDDRIRINEKVFFETGKATILERSHDVLNQVASVLLETPRIEQLRIEGHTDDVGADDYNQELSQERANSVRLYLIEQGINPDRIDSKGFGPTQPLVPNTSDRNRGLNRRVEFRIVDQGLDDGEAAEEAEPAAE